MYKKFLCAAFCSVLSLGLAFGVATNSQSSTENALSIKSGSVVSKAGEYDALFNDATAITRDDLRVEITSATSTNNSKSLTVGFTSVGIQGFTNTKHTVCAVIDDSTYSGDSGNPVLDSSLTKPYQFNGYVYEISDTTSDTDKTLVVPTKMKYGQTFVINNTRIASGVFISANNKATKMDKIVIPKEITTIEENAIIVNPYYAKTKDAELDGGKTYYTYDSSTKEYTAVASPVLEDIKSYYEQKMNDLEIVCEASAKPEGWAANWTNLDSSKVTFGYVLDSTEEGKKEVTTGSTYMVDLPELKERNQYIVGYVKTEANDYYVGVGDESNTRYTEEEIVNGKTPNGYEAKLVKDYTPLYNDPLVVKYDVKDKSGAVVKTVQEPLPIVKEEKTENCFNSTRDNTFKCEFDVILDDGQAIDYDSLEFTNIFKSKKEYVDAAGKDFVVPDESVRYKAVAIKRFEREIDVSEVIDIEYKGVRTFGSQTLVSMNVDKVTDPTFYEKQMTSVLKTHEEKIESGEYSIRYAFYNLSTSKFRVTYEGKDGLTRTEVKIITPVAVVTLEKDKGNEISFLLNNSDIGDDFNAKSLRRLELIGLTVNMHLWSNKEQNKVGRTELTVRFGGVDVLPLQNGPVQIFDIVLFLVIFGISYLVLFTAGSIGLFFFEREKFKNDEFRRVKPKEYLKKAILGGLGSFFVVMTITFIVMRFGFFNNSIAVHNPTDVFVVIGGLISIVIIGYFILYIVKLVKANKKRKETKRLKLNEDVADDGTN